MSVLFFNFLFFLNFLYYFIFVVYFYADFCMFLSFKCKFYHPMDEMLIVENVSFIISFLLKYNLLSS